MTTPKGLVYATDETHIAAIRRSFPGALSHAPSDIGAGFGPSSRERIGGIGE
jgi:hypothetical protein